MTMLPVSVLHKAVSTPRSTCRNTARHLQSPGSSGTANKAVSTHPIQQGQGKTPEARRRGRRLRLAPHTVCERRPICPEQQLNHGPYHRNGPGSAHQTTPPSDNTAALTSRTRRQGQSGPDAGPALTSRTRGRGLPAVGGRLPGRANLAHADGTWTTTPDDASPQPHPGPTSSRTPRRPFTGNTQPGLTPATRLPGSVKACHTAQSRVVLYSAARPPPAAPPGPPPGIPPRTLPPPPRSRWPQVP